MTLTKTVWTDHSADGNLILECTTDVDNSETDAYTRKTPARSIDGTRPWVLSHSATATLDTTPALVLNVWIGYGDDFALSGTGANVVAVSGAKYMTILDDVRLAVAPLDFAYLIDPNLGVADVVALSNKANGFKVNVPAAPYYAFQLDAGSAMGTGTTTWRIVQKQ